MPSKYHNRRYDDSELEYNKSHFSKVAFVAGATILGIAGYKSGTFKKTADNFIKHASKYSTDAISAVDAFRKWSNMTTSQFSTMSKEYDIGDISRSIRNKQNYKEVKFKDLRKQSTRQNLYKNIEHNVNTLFDRSRIDDTKRDFAYLKEMIKNNKIDYSSIKDTELYSNKVDINNTLKRLRNDGLNEAQVLSAEKKMYADYISKFKQMTEEANESVNRSGHRKSTIDDMYKYTTKDGKRVLSLKNNNVTFNADEKGETAETFLNDLYRTVKKHKLISDDDFLKLTIDSAVLTSEKGNISDLRGFKKTYNTMMNSLANDFKIPVIGINPLKMFGLGDSSRTYNFAAMAKGSVQNAVTNKSGKAGAINKSLFFSNGTVYDVDEIGNLSKVKENMSIHRVKNGSERVDKTLEGVRKMAGINKKSFDEYTSKDGKFKERYGKFAKFMDVGRSDINAYDVDEWGLNEALNPNTYMTKFTSWLSESKYIRPYKRVKATENYTGVFSTVDKFDDDLFIAVNKSTTINDVLEVTDNPLIPKVNTEKLKKHANQYLAGRGNMGDVSERTTTLFYSFDRVNNLLGSTGLGLSTDSTTSAGGIIKNMLLKRALPAYLGYTTYQSIVALTETENEDGTTNNIQKTMATGLAKTDLAYHKIKDATLVTSAFKELEKIMQGFDQIAELPGISALKLTNTYEEQLEYLENGMDPIRKGRFWDSGTSAYTGGKIDRFQASWYRRAMAEVEFSDSQYGSRKEWLQNQPLPNLASPLAPLRYFIGDRYHWDEKHYADRPYMETPPMFQNVPIVGGPLSATLGKMLKPTKRMHEEYWNNEEVNYTFGQERGTMPGLTNTLASNMPVGNSLFKESNISSMIPVLYSTKSGGSSIVGIDGSNIGNINYQLRAGNSLDKLTSNSMLRPGGGSGEADMITADMLASQDGLGFNTGEFYNSMNDFLGMHGFMGASVFGDANEDSMYIENSSYAYSNSRAFWNNDIGGLGGTLNEVTRRFLRKRLKDDQLYNPIRNTMPSWIPGSNYFLDLQHGDPYCVSLHTIIEKNELEFEEAGSIMKGDNIITHTGDNQEVECVAVRKVNNGEKVYSLKVNSLYGVNMEFSEEHPILIINNPTMRRQNSNVRVQKYIKANEVYEMIKNGSCTQKSIVKNSDMSYSSVCGCVKLLVENKIIDKSLNILKDKAFDIELMKKGMEWKPVSELNVGDYVAYPIPKFKSEDVILDLSKYTKFPSTDEYIYTSGKQKDNQFGIAYEYIEKNGIPSFKRGERKDFLSILNVSDRRYEGAAYMYKNNLVVKRIPRYVKITDDIAYMFGLYIAEGSLFSGCVTFTLNVKEEEYFNNAIRGAVQLDPCIDPNKCTWAKRGKTNGATGNIHSQILNDILVGMFDKCSKNKKLPNEIASLNNDILKHFLRGMFDGDGSEFIDNSINRHNKNKMLIVSYKTCNRTLALQIRKLCLKLNIVFNLTYDKPRQSNMEGKVINNRGSYILTVRGDTAKLFSNIVWDSDYTITGKTSNRTFIQNDYLYMRIGEIIEVDNIDAVVGYEVNIYDSFCVAGVATHNTKVSWGEGRLPGEGYERLWGIKPFDLGIGSSFLGKSEEDMVRHFLHADDITDSYLQNIVDTGTRYHERVEKKMIASGYAIDTEQTIYNEKYNIQGTYDIRLRDNSTVYGQSIMDIKTIGDKGYQEILNSGMKEEHRTQVNFYLNELGLDKGYVMYINRDNPDQMQTFSMEYDRGLFVDTIQRLESARTTVLNKVDSGEISRGDLYKPIDRLRILGDVAPYSQEYEDMNTYVSKLSLSEEDKKEVRAIRDRVTQQRNPKRLYEYKFKDIQTESETAMIDTLFDDGTFTVYGSDKKFKLAGIDMLKNDDPYKEDERMDYLNKVIGPGNIVNLEFDRNPNERIKGTSTKVIVHSNALDGFANVNKSLIQKGYATENDSDNGLDLKVTMNGLERAAGSMLETITHLDTPINTKFMKVRTAKEDYERERVYGNGGYGLWSNPIRDYYKPLVLDRNIGRGTISGLAMAFFVGKMFGSNKFGAIVGATTTTTMVLGGKLYAGAYKGVTGSTWRPERVRKEQELNEYIDMLKYVKYRKLYEEYKQKAKYQSAFVLNGVDVDEILEKEARRGRFNKKRERDTNEFAMNVKKAHQNGRSIRETALFGPNTDEYSIGGMLWKSIQDGLNFKEFLSSSIKNKMEYEYARQTEDYSNSNNRGADGKKLKYFNYSSAKEQYDEDMKEQEYKDAKKSIANERKRLKGSKRIVGVSGVGDYASANNENAIADRISNIASLRSMLDSNNKTYIDEDIETAIEGTGLSIRRDRKGNIDRDKLMQEANESINNLSRYYGINEDAVMALMYYKLSEQTMYAYDEGDPITDLMKSMPKRDRDYFNHFVKASDDEKLRILDMVPKYMRRPLQSSWGLTVEQKTNINSYFNERPLPGADWEGWNEDVDLDAVKVKMVKREGMEFKDNNIWKDDVRKANMVDVPIPRLESKTLTGRDTLKKLLTRSGFQDIQIHDAWKDVTTDTQLYLTYDEKKRYKEEINKKMNENFI